MIEESLRTHCLSRGGVAEMIGDRFGPVKVSAGMEFPNVWYEVTAHTWPATMDGPGGDGRITLELHCQAFSSAEARELANLLASADPDGIHGFRGVMANAEHVQACLVGELRDQYFPPNDGGDEGVHRVTVPVRIFYTPLEE